MEKLLLTTREVAELLGVGRNRVYELMYSGKLPSVKLGGSRRVSAAAVEAFVAALEQPEQ